jgi:predicted nucleic acid-binding protein
LKTSRVAVDASFLLKLFLPEDSSDQVEERWRNWIESSIEVFAPTLIVFEASSVLRNKVFRGTLDEAEASEMIDKLGHLDLSLVYAKELMEMAWEVGKTLKAPALYDSYYIAVAKFFEAPLWTADERLYKSARKHFPFINRVR